MKRVFERAAAGALIEWGIEGELDDLVQELWVWYLERPSVKRKLCRLSEPEQITTVKMHAHQIISEKVLSGNVSTGKVVYSVDSVKEALKGRSTNKHLLDLLPLAMRQVQKRDDAIEDSGKYRGYAEAIRSRYEDNVVPPQGKDHHKLSHAVKALTDEVNVLYLTTNAEGVGCRSSVFPESRRKTGVHGDPTANIALTLIENPDVRDAYLEELPLDLFLKGEHAQPVRWDVQRDAWVRDVPGAGDTGAVPA